MVGCDTSAPPSGRSVHIGRQPIFDTAGRLHAYELLFRRDCAAVAADVGPDADHGDRATTSTILAAFSGFPVADLLGGLPGFVNLTRAFLVGDLPVPFDPDQAVLEVLESVQIDQNVLNGVRGLHEAGYRIALDDFVWTPLSDALLELAEIVKIDVLTPWEQVVATVRRCRDVRGDDLVMLAERVENEATRRRCLDTGFALFQGYHLGRPQTLTAETLSSDRLVALQLLGRLSAADVQLRDVESILRVDPGLVLQLLRLANASSNGLSRTITSIGDAVVLLGLNRLRSWMVLLAVSGLGAQVNQASSVLVRGRTCEELATRLDRPDLDSDAAFIVGLLDGIAELIGIGPAVLLGGLPPLATAITDTLTGKITPLRQLLDAVRGYHLDDDTLLAQAGLPRALVTESFLAALAWTTQTMAAVQDGALDPP